MQTDLFEIPAQAGFQDKQNNLKTLEDYRISLRLDQCLIVAIALLVAFAMAFTAGVQKGKQGMVPAAEVKAAVDAARKQQAAASLAARPVTAEIVSPFQGPRRAFSGPAIVTAAGHNQLSQDARVVIVEPSSKPETPVSDRPEGSYTIQMVTYKTDKEARQRIEILAQKGLQGFVIPSGAYRQVCVNGFGSREEAKAFMADLKAKGIIPSDAYVRSYTR